jgi:hypothetical protein
MNYAVDAAFNGYEDNTFEREAYDYEKSVVPFVICGDYCDVILDKNSCDPICGDDSPLKFDQDLDGICDPGKSSSICERSDSCPNTPLDDRPVDDNGCSQQQVDEDLDGVCDPGASSSLCTGSDRCPNTSDPTVDENGCSADQVDQDLDGVCDPGVISSLCSGSDSCPNTPVDDRPVDINGCSPQQRFVFLVSKISSDEDWCITAMEGVKDFANLGFRRCDFEGAPARQLWRLDADGKIHSKVDTDKCMIVNFGENLFDGVRMRVDRCDIDTTLNTFTHESDSGKLHISANKDYCVTNRGTAPHSSDTIHAKPCKDEDRFALTIYV